jgi:exopolysaccharide biosynthesis polyprenyl glycosylphosphotransferase
VFLDYLPLMLIGAGLLLGGFAQQDAYDERLLLRRHHGLRIVVRTAVVWFFGYLSISLVLKFEPPISRLFVIYAFAATLLLLLVWRQAFHLAICGTRLGRGLRRRTVIQGWSPRAEGLLEETRLDPSHPFEIVGWIPTNASEEPPDGVVRIPSIDALATGLRELQADLLISAAEPGSDSEWVAVARACEEAYCEWKIIPAARQVFLAALRLETVGSIPLLGAEEPPMRRLMNRVGKRLLDVSGAAFGLITCAPIMLVAGLWVRSQSPGPLLFCQRRVGLDHREFRLWKLRTMVPGSELVDAENRDTRPDDPRVTPAGRWLRRWNIDEMPQFWNVLVGDMSLVGPRPERPHHVALLAGSLDHYLPRHRVKPGMTGWAQVSGLRGNTSREVRHEHDLFYVQNGSLWLDLQILLLTFLRWRNPAE